MAEWMTLEQAIKLWHSKVVPKLQPNSECLLFVGAHTNGYGAVRANKKGHYTVVVYVHRLKLFIETGTWPETTLHKCSNRHCVVHVEPGTQKQNMHDLILSGKHNLVTAEGRRKLRG